MPAATLWRMVGKFGSASEWFRFAAGILALGLTVLGFSAASWSPEWLIWAAIGILVVGVLLCFFGVLVWRSNMRADVSARAVGTPNSDRLTDKPARPIRPALTEYYRDLALENPLSAILKAYLAVEGWFDITLEENGLDKYDGTRKRSVREMSRIAAATGLLPSATVPTIDGLGVLRDLALDKQGEGIGSEEAQRYLLQTEGALLSLDNSLKPIKK